MVRFLFWGILSHLFLVIQCSSPREKENHKELDSEQLIKERFGNYNITASGIRYRIHSSGNGPEIDTGDIVEIHYSGSLLDGAEFDNSYKRKKPFSFKIGSGHVIAGWDEGIPLLRVGDKATFFIPSQLAYGSRKKPGIPANSDLVFEVEPLKKFARPIPFDSTGFKKNISESGLEYYLIKKTRKKGIALGDTIKIHYTGYLPNGEVFDSSVQRGEPIEFVYKEGSVIKGWMEALGFLKKGEKAKIIVPPNLAYGSEGYGIIPANATLMFDIEVIVD